MPEPTRDLAPLPELHVVLWVSLILGVLCVIPGVMAPRRRHRRP